MEAKYYKDKESYFFYKILDERRSIKVTNFKHTFGIEYIENRYIVKDIMKNCLLTGESTFAKAYFRVLNKLNKTFVKS